MDCSKYLGNMGEILGGRHSVIKRKFSPVLRNNVYSGLNPNLIGWLTS